MAKFKSKFPCYLTFTPQTSLSHYPPSLNALLLIPKKPISKPLCYRLRCTFIFSLLISCSLMATLAVNLASHLTTSFLIPIKTSNPCVERDEDGERGNKDSVFMAPFPERRLTENLNEEEKEFWKQPNGLGYEPCLHFSIGYRRASRKKRKGFVMVVVSGGLNQQRNQIVDAVVIARILEATLVVPVLKFNLIWEDNSEFSDIFDAEHFKMSLRPHVPIVTSLPSSYPRLKPYAHKIPRLLTPLWLRAKFINKLGRGGVILLKGLTESRLSKDLPLDLQKLRCKVAFHAMRFSAPIRAVGMRLAERMWTKGPYIALHLRLEKDVWVRTGCLPGLSPVFDDIVVGERIQRPELLTGRLNITYHKRKAAGLCPLNALEVARLLEALGAPRSSRIYWAGGEALGGDEALRALVERFTNLVKKETLALPGELEPFINKSSALAAVDYIVALYSDVFMPSHGGNMARTMQGHRAYLGHKKYITPNKRGMSPYFSDHSLPEAAFVTIAKHLHKDKLGQPRLRCSKKGRDVTAFPVPECMCRPLS
ncbi:uncharacterized protein At1g04910 isoform X1 [Amborella trichopoda]|nr:uncharacterized protein At1g04910 isoform X1 [Amborella trichopoda]|eukprot:XP_006840183.2 uncharacterized protein At1g04910 isoform X1 [Amborella trichopoda]